MAAVTHILSLADGDAADQLFCTGGYSVWTPIMRACVRSAPLVLVQLMITKVKLDPRKRCLLAITCNGGYNVLHYAAGNHGDPAVLELLIRECPLALQTTDGFGRNPPQWTTVHNCPATIRSLLTDATNALFSRDYAALGARVHGSAFALRCLASPSYAARLAFRTSLLLCLKTVYPATPTEPLYLCLAHARLCKDVWSVILEFV